MENFYIDNKQEISISWENLIKEISNNDDYNPFCKEVNIFNTFKNIITSMLISKEIVLLDADFTDNELIQLTGNSKFDKFNEIIDKKKFPIIKTKDELLIKLKETSKNWKITLFTSGTTGIPKKITHNFNSITRFVKTSNKNLTSIWGFAYNPTHIAGIQVFMQALLNGNTIINLFGLTPKEIKKQIKKNQITHISATPTFYKLLLPCNDIFNSTLRITSGGEKFHNKTIEQLQNIFPNAKITNVYASTEAGTLFASKNDIFNIKKEYINLVRIKNNELLIHNSLMGHSEAAAKDWYHTGDLVEIISEKPLKFRFISRESDTINVGGYNVNPLEVEEAILSLSGIKDVRVYAKSNSVLGNIICCEVIITDSNINESTIRSYLQSKVQEFKIPRMIHFVDRLSTTRTGKIKRK